MHAYFPEIGVDSLVVSKSETKEESAYESMDIT